MLEQRVNHKMTVLLSVVTDMFFTLNILTPESEVLLLPSVVEGLFEETIVK